MRQAACRPGSAVEFSQGCDGFYLFFCDGGSLPLFWKFKKRGPPWCPYLYPSASIWSGLLLLQFYVSIAKCVYEIKESNWKLIRLEETVTIQSTCFVKDVQLIAWYLFTQNKSWVFLTYINIKLLYIKQKLIFQVSTREILVFLYYGIKTFSDIGVK